MFPLSARIVTLETLFLMGRFAPAAVQRDYRWGQEHCDALLGDLLSAFERSGLAPLEPDEAAPPPTEEAEPEGDGADQPEAWLLPSPPAPPERFYYLGSVMLSPGEDGAHLIYDGLQRLTTLTVLFACLRDYCDPSPAGVRGLIRDEEGRPRLRLDFADHALSYDVQREGAARARWRNAEGLTDAGRRLREAIALFRRQIGRMTPAASHAFAEFLRARVLFNLVAIEDWRLATQAFVTTNDRGLALGLGDVLKGQIVDYIGAGLGPVAAGEAAQAWTRLAAAAGDGFDEVLRAADFIVRTRNQSADCLHRFFAEYVMKIGPEGAAAFVADQLPGYCEARRRLRANLDFDDVDGFDASCRMLSILPFTEWLPLAMLLIQRRKPGRLERDMADLARTSMMVLLKGYSARDRAVIYGRAIRQLREKRNPFNGALSFRFENARAVAAALDGPFHEPATRAAVVRWLEALHWPQTLPNAVISRRNTVEHILPVRPPAGSDWRMAFPDPEERDALIDTIGNLALLPQEENEALGARDFEEKRERYAKLRAHFRLLEGLQQVPRWTPEAVRARTARLRTLALQALGLDLTFA